MYKELFLALLRQHRAIAVIRAGTVDSGLAQAQAAAAGGMRLIEVTWDSASPARLVDQLRQSLPNCTIGMGTAFSLKDLKHGAAAGAQFCVCPHIDLALIRAAEPLQIPIVPGALTPNEIVAAWQAGATAVKVFPIGAVGGASYVRSLQGPLGHIPLVPTGGVTVENAGEMVRAGAIALGLSTGLFPKQAVAAQDWPAIAKRCSQLVASLNDRGG
ncbi:MAG TPA: bifunctional 4-hydroxy-2-oxoglutarate aldolase/2-dehydro-3-deoxy-phosphogluconate aldolase [Nodosilinea sp.]|nr:bifunctional 4-hydroxy-2-oxoglutarate aldolase/2-dehydro-3-deoxy-phosphogluconate aldolase [Nodosilinea sp.]